MFDITGFGVATLDVITEVEKFPSSGGKAKILSRENHGGGLTATALVAASKLGASCWYGGPLGENEISRQVRRILQGYGVNLPVHSPYPPETEPIAATVYVEHQTGERTVLWSEFLTPPPILNEEAVKTALSAKCLFADQFYAETLIPLYRQVREKRIPIVGDFESLGSPAMEEALALVDHLIVPAAFVRKRFGQDADLPDVVVRLLHEHDRSAVVVTDGVKGAWFAEKGDDTVRHQKAFPVTVCDTTGCGDVFHGAYAATLTSGMSLADRVRYAAGAAALKATRKGGQTGAPTRNELEEFLINSKCKRKGNETGKSVEI
ncbi:MAG: PfkB family carbohydrate kinase [Planctomycetaceae bacterium]|nr:PfkB family carbohydrate kinase [Planctomycetaceae bacterium]MCL2304214.1 PfkB family carbohydrate kinase [Planctomycetaceae bacterium]